MSEPRQTISVLLRLTERLSAHDSLEGALREVTDAALELLPGNHASVRLLNQREELVCTARSGDGRSASPAAFRKGEGLLGWVANNGQVARVDDVTHDPRFATVGSQGFELRSLLSAPLQSSGAVIGVLAVAAREPCAFSSEHETMARLLANCTVPPIERAQLKRLALTDHRTLAFNERFLVPRLDEEMDRARRYGSALSALLLDLDRFKQINDEHGHVVGDLFLRHFADLVRQTVRSHDVLVRRGGEEFVLIMPQTPTGAAEAVAERIRQTVTATPLLVDNTRSLGFTVSIGVATWDGQESATSFEGRADAAMYVAKRTGRNRVSVAPRDLS